MRPLNRYIYLQYLWILVLLALILVACSSEQPLPSPTSAVNTEVAERPTSTPVATLTPTFPPPAAILLAPTGSDPNLSEALQPVLEDLSAQSGLQFEVVDELAADDLEAGARMVIALAPDTGIASLAASAPDTQFLAIGMPDVQPADNLSVIVLPASRPDQLAFAAGYLAAAITEDWRVAVISGSDAPSGKAAEVGFTNGVYFLCGLCRPIVPPFPIPGYPLTAQLPPSASETDWQSAIEYFQTWQVSTAYVAPDAADPGFLKALADAGIHIIGSVSPPPDLRSSWAATVISPEPATAMQEIWPALLEGQVGQNIPLSISLEDINPELVSPGRQGLVEEMLVDLQAGYIDTGVDPETGESRWAD